MPTAVENLPVGLDNNIYQWVDLDGEGISGIVTEQGKSWFYKPNLGEGKFRPLEVIASQPALASLRRAVMRLLDLAGDGQFGSGCLRRSNAGVLRENPQ